MQRRSFLATAGSCAAHLGLAAALPPALTRRWIRPSAAAVARAPFGTLEEVAEGIWALISTPLDGDRTTLCNGGLVRGANGVLAVEAFYTPAGATWLAERSVELTGRRPTHVVLTHYHADHVTGLPGYGSGADRPAALTTVSTAEQAALDGIQFVAPREATTIDLGGRQAMLTPRAGHTASDITIAVDDPHVVFCGDLVWNGMFPNYVDTTPTRLAAAVRALRADAPVRWVPGHGPLAGAADLDRYLAMLDAVEDGARRAHARGIEADTAGAAFVLPAALGAWTLFGRTFLPRAFAAWYRELDGR